MSEAKVWQRRLDLGEPRIAYHAFCHWRGMDPSSRTLNGAYTNHRVACKGATRPQIDPTEIGTADSDSPETRQAKPRNFEANKRWLDWKKKFQWEARAVAFDNEMELDEAVAHRKAIREMNLRQAKIAQVGQGRVITGLNALDASKLTATQIALLAREFTTMERRALGEPTEIVKQQTSEAIDYSKCSEADLERLFELERERDRILAGSGEKPAETHGEA